MGACGAQKKTRYEAEFLVLFDTLTKIVAYTESKEEFSRFTQLIYDNLKEYHELYDIYHDYPGINNIRTINDNAGIKPVKVDKRIIDLLLFSEKEYKKTEGRVNVAYGTVLKIWHDYRTAGIEDPENAALPPMDKLREAAGHTDINNIIIDEANSTVFLKDPEMSLDVGAVGKGYATEQVCQIAIKNGFTSGLVSVGGNVRAIGSKGVNGELWNLGIQNPDKESSQSNLKIVFLADLSVVSSGVYERYYTVGSKDYHHIIDPDTLFPSEYFAQVTIITRDSGLADALSTAVFNLPFEKGLEYINSLPDTEAMWVMKNGEIKYSDNFMKYLKE
jgi:thiamine biosynthesis lipoprotein